MSYKDTNPLEKRISESNRILTKYPSHIPVLIECSEKLCLGKQKFLVPGDVSASHLLYSVRKQIKMDSSKAMFMFCDKAIVCPTTLMSEIYQKHMNNKKKEEKGDKFLTIVLTSENTFGYNKF